MFWYMFGSSLQSCLLFWWHSTLSHFIVRENICLCIFWTCCSGISSSPCVIRSTITYRFVWMTYCVLDCVKREVRLAWPKREPHTKGPAGPLHYTVSNQSAVCTCSGDRQQYRKKGTWFQRFHPSQQEIFLVEKSLSFFFLSKVLCTKEK